MSDHKNASCTLSILIINGKFTIINLPVNCLSNHMSWKNKISTLINKYWLVTINKKYTFYKWYKHMLIKAISKKKCTKNLWRHFCIFPSITVSQFKIQIRKYGTFYCFCWQCKQFLCHQVLNIFILRKCKTS